MKMKYPFLLFFVIVCFSACDFFDTERVSSETIYEEEVRAIDWADVDAYPLFENCEEDMDKNRQKTCFIQTINNRLMRNISNQNFIASEELSDTLWIVFEISEKGKVHISKMEMDSMLMKELPHLKNLLLKNIDSLPSVKPAYKRGIPVKTQFTLPVVIHTE